jgi:hypothetical protein
LVASIPVRSGTADINLDARETFCLADELVQTLLAGAGHNREALLPLQ